MSRDIQDLSYWAFSVCVGVCVLGVHVVTKLCNTHKPEKNYERDHFDNDADRLIYFRIRSVSQRPDETDVCPLHFFSAAFAGIYVILVACSLHIPAVVAAFLCQRSSFFHMLIPPIFFTKCNVPMTVSITFALSQTCISPLLD